MTTIIHNKLIRDNIPEIIAKSGKACTVRSLTEPEYIEALRGKLHEETAEYEASGSLEELADILEVIYALCEADGHTATELESTRLAKCARNGGFNGRLFLESVTEQS